MDEQGRTDYRQRVNGHARPFESRYAEKQQSENGRHPRSVTLRDLLSIGFRRQRLVLSSSLVIFVMAALLVLLRPAQYESEMKTRVHRERVDPLVTTEASSTQSSWTGVNGE